MVGTYDLWLVLLSIVVAVIASYVALDLASRVAASQGSKAARYWLNGGAISMGTGIWSMHFIGMLAFRLPIPMSYDVPLTLLSLLIAVIVSGFALHTVSHGTLSMRRLLGAGLLMGIGIASMHYTGMAAMEVWPPIRYEPLLFVLSIVIAVAAAVAALWIAFQLRSETISSAFWTKAGSALVMGAAISGMHYTAMAAANFAPNSVCLVSPQDINNVWLASTIGGFTFMFLTITLLISLFDARLADRSAKLAETLRKANVDLVIHTTNLSRANALMRQEGLERMQAEIALRESEERYRQLVELSPDGIFIHSGGKIVFVNGACTRLLGAATPDELIGKPVLDLFHPDQQEIVKERMRQLREENRPAPSLEEKIIRLDGTVVDVEATASPFMHKGKPSTQVVMRDITERKHAEQARARIASIVESSQDAILSRDLNGRILSWNAGAERLFGYTEAEALGRDVSMLIPPDRHHEFPRDKVLLERGEAVAPYETERATKDGRRIAVSQSLSPIKDDAGAITGVATIFRDISERKQVEQARANLVAIVENANDAIISRALDGTILSWNAGAERLFGYSAAEALGQPIEELIHLPEVRARIAQNVERVRRGEAVAPYETRRKTKDGRVIDVLSSVSPIRNEAGEVIAASVILHDISALKQAEVAMQESEERFRAAFEQAGVGMGLRDIDPRKPRWLRVNQKLCDILGYTREELLQLTSVDITPPDERNVAIDYNERLLRGEITSYSRDKRYVRKDGQIIWTNITLSAVSGPDGRPTHIISVIQDMTERKKAEEQLIYLAQYDALTGLPNRNLFRDRLALAMARAKRNDQILALMLLDLDHFKEINDTLGHTTGDGVLQTVAGLLRKSLRDVDTIARLGGDEFTIILENITHVDQVTTVADKIQQAFSDPIVIQGRDIFVTASIGITLYPFGVDEIDALLQTTDIAMYRAKEEGRNTYEFYAPEMDAHAAERLDMENLLRRALERYEFVLHYQPKVSVKSGRITGVEALIRWNSKELGFVSPSKFIPLAEKIGLIVPIGEWVLRTACVQAKAWQDQGFPPLPVSVNLSPRQFRQKNLVETIAGWLRDTGLDPRFLELEITESMIMLHADKAIAILLELHQLGVQLSVDDFGTGYSSLAYLKRFPVQKLKIDQSFVRSLSTDANDAGIVSAVIAMAKSLELGVVAEGVETKEQLAFLAKLNCDEYQGYYFSRPVLAEDFARLLESPLQAAAPDIGASAAATRRGRSARGSRLRSR